MNRLFHPEGSLTGAWRPGDEAARDLALEIVLLREQQAHEVRSFLRDDAPALLALLRRIGAARACVLVEAALISMASRDDAFERLDGSLVRALGAVVDASGRPDLPEHARDELRVFARHLDHLRGLSAEIIHRWALSCMAARRARRREPPAGAG